jgi:hypothetical protein
MSDVLRPMSMGEILDRTALIYRRNWWCYFGISAAPMLLSVIVTVAFLYALHIPKYAYPIPGVQLIYIIFFFHLILMVFPVLLALDALANSSLIEATRMTWSDEKISIFDSLRKSLKRKWANIGVEFLAYLFNGYIPLGIFLLATFLFYSLSNAGFINISTFQIAFWLGVIVFLISEIFIWTHLAVMMPAMLVEQLGPWSALKRIMKLVRGYKGRVFIFGALNYLFAVVFTIVSVILFLFVFGIIVEIYETNFHHGPSALIDTAAMIMIYAGLLTAKTMVKPIYVIALTFLYFDLRIRKEGYDIEKMMEKAGLIITSATSGINSTKLIEEGAE